MSIVKGSLPVIGFTLLLWLFAGPAYIQAEPISPPDYSLSNEALEDIHAPGIRVGGDSSTSRSTSEKYDCSPQELARYQDPIRQCVMVYDGHLYNYINGMKIAFEPTIELGFSAI